MEELRTERAQIEEAITALERLARGHVKCRGPTARLDDADEETGPPAWDREQAQSRSSGLVKPITIRDSSGFSRNAAGGPAFRARCISVCRNGMTAEWVDGRRHVRQRDCALP